MREVSMDVGLTSNSQSSTSSRHCIDTSIRNLLDILVFGFIMQYLLELIMSTRQRRITVIKLRMEGFDVGLLHVPLVALKGTAVGQSFQHSGLLGFYARYQNVLDLLERIRSVASCKTSNSFNSREVRRFL